MFWWFLAGAERRTTSMGRCSISHWRIGYYRFETVHGHRVESSSDLKAKELVPPFYYQYMNRDREEQGKVYFHLHEQKRKEAGSSDGGEEWTWWGGGMENPKTFNKKCVFPPLEIISLRWPCSSEGGGGLCGYEPSNILFEPR